MDRGERVAPDVFTRSRCGIATGCGRPDVPIVVRRLQRVGPSIRAAGGDRSRHMDQDLGFKRIATRRIETPGDQHRGPHRGIQDTAEDMQVHAERVND